MRLPCKSFTDKQIARIVHSKKFMADYGNEISSSSHVNQSSNAWIAEMSKRIIGSPPTVRIVVTPTQTT